MLPVFVALFVLLTDHSPILLCFQYFEPVQLEESFEQSFLLVPQFDSASLGTSVRTVVLS